MPAAKGQGVSCIFATAIHRSNGRLVECSPLVPASRRRQDVYANKNIQIEVVILRSADKNGNERHEAQPKRLRFYCVSKSRYYADIVSLTSTAS